ncbi:MAG TPA: hypothetical protein VM553_12890 [Dongiaceae bacterium]|nr:hypothetical protein [Dongiaceae bacterium]
MTHSSLSGSAPPTVSCAVCGDAVSLAEVLQQKGKPLVVCRNFECRRVAGLRDTLAPPIFKAQFEFHQRRIRTYKEQQAQQRQHITAIEQAEAEENARLLDEFLAQHPEHQDSPPPLLTLPLGRTDSEPPAETRVQAYRQHLQKVIEQAFACQSVNDLPSDHHMDSMEIRQKVDVLFAAYPALQAVSDRFCMQCKGGCCTAGGDHAFVSAVTIMRLREAEPDLTADVILQRYLDAVPVESVPGGCINQTSSGCILPREWRSDVCNGFYCDSLRHLQKQWSEGEAPSKVLTVQRANHNWNRFEGDKPFPVVGIALVNLQ